MAANQPIPIFTDLATLYANLGTTFNHAERWDNLTKEFVQRFGRKPTYIARAPGRVNLIGDHIDYALFGALPTAVERDILIACAPRESTATAVGTVNAQNLQPQYTPASFTPSPLPRSSSITVGASGEASSGDDVYIEGWHLDIDTKQLRWESYVKAGYYGVLNQYFTDSDGVARHRRPVPVDLLFTGSVPAGSGLSSSAAMVVASTLAFLAVNSQLDDARKPDTPSLSKGELVKMAMKNEQRVGVNSGGLDQSASVICKTQTALYIQFYPHLKASDVSLPVGGVYVCANSLVVSDKVVGAATRYNLRVVETLVGARVLGRLLGLASLDVGEGRKEKVTFREVLGRLAGEDLGKDKSGEGLDEEALKAMLVKLGKDVEVLRPIRNGKAAGDDEELGVTLEEMIALSGLSADEFKAVYLANVHVEATHFQLYKRAKHVFAESLKVLQFREVCLANATTPNSSTNEKALQELGRLMNESQTSLSQVFQSSCPELDLLTKLAREAGAYGSRVTGAGWGGCTVSLVPESHVDAFINKMRDTYPAYKGLEGHALSEVIFATRPSSGACVYKFT